MGDLITVYLREAFANIDDDEAVRVYSSELWKPADASMRGFKNLIEVYDDNEDTYYVNDDIIADISNRMF